MLRNTGRFVVGDSEVGNLEVQAGGAVLTTNGSGVPALAVAASNSASGSAIGVSGTGSSLGVTGALVVGQGGSGALSVTQGASVSATTLQSGMSATASGIITLSGTSSALGRRWIGFGGGSAGNHS